VVDKTLKKNAEQRAIMVRRRGNYIELKDEHELAEAAGQRKSTAPSHQLAGFASTMKGVTFKDVKDIADTSTGETRPWWNSLRRSSKSNACVSNTQLLGISERPQYNQCSTRDRKKKQQNVSASSLRASSLQSTQRSRSRNRFATMHAVDEDEDTKTMRESTNEEDQG
jgi:hypothetical protein